MSWLPLWDKGPIVVFHAGAALLAMGLGAVQLAAPKGTSAHRVLGNLWAGLMALVAISSFWIHDFRLLGPFSPIHLLSVLVLVSLVQAIRAARRRDIDSHRRDMRSLFGLALLITGALTLLPGRAMHAVVFGG